jgi:hypothetical protein
MNNNAFFQESYQPTPKELHSLIKVRNGCESVTTSYPAYDGTSSAQLILSRSKIDSTTRTTRSAAFLSSHAVSTELVADPPIYTIRISSYDLNQVLSHGREACDNPEPAPSQYVTSETPITVIDFVKSVHEDYGEARTPVIHHASTAPQLCAGTLLISSLPACTRTL